MQRSLTAIKKEKVEESQSSNFQEANQIDEITSSQKADRHETELVEPEDMIHPQVNPTLDENVNGQRVSTLIQDPEPVNEEEHQRSSSNKPKEKSDNQTGYKKISFTTEIRGPKIALSKTNSDQHSKEKTEERRYRAETITGRSLEGQNERATVAGSSNRPNLPPLKIKAPAKSFCGTLQQIKSSEQEKMRKKKKRKRVKEEENCLKIVSCSLSGNEGPSNVGQETSKRLNPDQTRPDLHFCYEVVV